VAKTKVEEGLATWADIDEALLRLCDLATDRQVMEAELNERLTAARAEYEDGLNEIATEDARLRERVEQFAREHEGEFVGSIVERMHGILSLRKTPPAVKVLPRKWTDQERMNRIREALGRDCVRVIEEIARDVILAKGAAKTITAADLAAAGLRIGQHVAFDLTLRQDATPAAAKE
jgi:phage host-nuclease inhibitor protein Gam